ncbi:hypothetical protein O3M35_001126 [Rhynocoris fuscipes]|uniref:Uncharacterized protein n=1 Tax=Rhynocoris fuscipes TaxID=488301 RepID=A0AAW1DTA1_9HEMI
MNYNEYGYMMMKDATCRLLPAVKMEATLQQLCHKSENITIFSNVFSRVPQVVRSYTRGAAVVIYVARPLKSQWKNVNRRVPSIKWYKNLFATVSHQYDTRL